VSCPERASCSLRASSAGEQHLLSAARADSFPAADVDQGPLMCNTTEIANLRQPAVCYAFARHARGRPRRAASCHSPRLAAAARS
jgi:hypothetical protein